MTLQEWLDSKLYPDDPTPLVKERLAELIHRNGGLAVHGWGALQSGGLYGWMGLDQDDAMELIHLGGVIAGLKLALGDQVEVELTQVMKAQWTKKEAE